MITGKSQEGKRIARIEIRTSRIRPKDKQGDSQEDRRENSLNALSPQTQLEEGIEYCSRHGLEVDAAISLELADVDVSGSKVGWRKRPNLMKHYQAAKLGLFTDLVFYKMARAGRNLRDTLDLINAFEALGVTIHGIKENVDSHTSHGRFMRNLLLSVAEWQADDLASTVQDTILTRAKRGDINGRYPLMWLKRNATGGYDVIDEVERSMMRLVELRMNGLGYNKIASNMNSEGHRTAAGHLWTGGKVLKYLSPTYIDSMRGTAFLYRDAHEDDPRRVVIPGVFPPILTEEQAMALRKVQERNRVSPMISGIPGGGNWKTNMARNGRYRADSKYLLAGVLYCPVCGARLLSMQHGRDRPNVRSYKCPHAAAFPEGHIGAGHSIIADSLEDGVLRVLRLVLKKPPLPVVRPVRKKPTRDTGKIKQEIDVLVDMRIKEIISEEIYKGKYKALQDELAALERTENEPDTNNLIMNSMEISLEGENVTQSQLRQLVLLLVKRVEAPVVIPGTFVRGEGTGLRRHAVVQMNISDSDGVTTWLVPLYLPRYQGKKDTPRAAADRTM